VSHSTLHTLLLLFFSYDMTVEGRVSEYMFMFDGDRKGARSRARNCHAYLRAVIPSSRYQGHTGFIVIAIQSCLVSVSACLT